MKDISYIDKIVKQHRTNLHKIAELSHVEFKTAKYIREMCIRDSTGFDGIYNRVSIDQLSSYLNALNKEDNLPKTILYSLNPVDNAAIGTLIGCFQEAGVCGKIQQGSAWWFNDHKTGMIEQMTSLANLGLLGNFIGMLTDSRSFLSYTRHEYFRRIMCELIGGWVANGEYPNDEKVLERMKMCIRDRLNKENVFTRRKLKSKP